MSQLDTLAELLTSSASKSGHCGLLVLEDVSVWRKIGCANSGEVGTCCWEVRAENLSSSEAAVCVVIACWSCDSRIATCKHDGDSLHTELHVLMALTRLI